MKTVTNRTKVQISEHIQQAECKDEKERLCAFCGHAVSGHKEDGCNRNWHEGDDLVHCECDKIFPNPHPSGKGDEVSKLDKATTKILENSSKNVGEDKIEMIDMTNRKLVCSHKEDLAEIIIKINEIIDWINKQRQE